MNYRKVWQQWMNRDHREGEIIKKKNSGVEKYNSWNKNSLEGTIAGLK